MSEDGFIFLLSLGATLLFGILAVAQISAYRLNQRRQLRQHEVLAPEIGSVIEPELDLGEVVDLDLVKAQHVHVDIRHAETAR